MKAMSSHHHNQQCALHFLAWKIESHMGGQGPSNRTPIEVYIDGSKINDQTGSAFCAISNEAIPKTWKAKLSPANTMFQAEMLALKAAIEWVNIANEEVNIWSDSESSLQALTSFYVKSKITQEAQMTLLENARIRLGWVKTHIGIKGNEIADTLAKGATTDRIPVSLLKKFPKETTTTAFALALAS
ncbi:hypothetical protein AVEN_243697-1 [Araneus ventricosus]|uniref:RNase H type-1 domain-containing protein n=1 Tax=Araneus ventricosus TaxID=182803 RepID=A0A4Y2A601_ARAVE|nr:hypothetical protein AVEN_243697-1 [Araneus ventricosus]